ncbi:protein kinase domain-containing protein [Sandarakinorhabdus sp. DWP1-3-1]|uniref:serine/threonine-protein kinase n=1 Tax=Sandarakinorhabdus sp. DWP1-3-1 TaxID=2804627 RepID=UPI003CE8FC0D
MSDQPPDDTPESDRTIIRPAGAPTPAAAPPPAADRTIMAPGASSAPPSSAPPPSATVLGGVVPMAPRTDGDRIQVGDVLNHIFEVKRFLARGGMGEVFEGINVNSDERVAIKVILPALAADPNVQAMFRKEARTLTRLSHPALVQYRVLAQEPQLGVFYIVTEFIDGVNLSDVLSELKPEPAELVALCRRLAEGLAAAHMLGAIHRDISPDNVLLEDRRLDRAKIIDFGIAKDLDPGSKTIIGDGFAGKLGYVAPEQLGDFDREVGPWSDVYSLGLVMLAVAQGKNVDMGASFVEAIDRRRKGADTSAAPAALRPVLDRMLTPDPQARLRSMEAVIAALAAPAPAPAPAPAAKPVPKAKPAAAPVAARAGTDAKPGGNRGLMIGGGVGLVALLGLGGWLAFGGTDTPPVVATAPTATAAPAAGRAEAAVAAALPSLSCTWLDLLGASDGPGGVTMAFAGVAGAPALAEKALSDAAAASGARIGATDFSAVAPIDASECASIDAFRAIRASGTPHLSVPQRKFEMSVLPPDSPYAGKIGARAIVNLDIANPAQDFALYGIEPSGAISEVIPDRKTFAGLEKNGTPIADLGGDRYRLQIDADHTGWSGILLLTGNGGFTPSIFAGKKMDPAAFAAAAATHGWKAEMVWFKMVDEVKE